MKKYFALFDTKIQEYMSPLVFHSQGEAIRVLQDMINDTGDNTVKRHPEDFHLFELAEFDPKTGVFHSHEAPVSVCSALSLKIEKDV